MCSKTKKDRQIGTCSHLLHLCFWNCSGYFFNVRFGIEDFANESYIILLVETLEHDGLGNYNILSLIWLKMEHDGLGNYKILSLIWLKIPRQRRGQGGVACLTETELSIIKNEEHIVLHMA